MILYATDTDLGGWSTDLPDDTGPYLRRASQLVAKAIARARYDVDAAGKPTDPWHIDATRDATCEQVAFWLANGIDPIAGEAGLDAMETSTSIAGASVSVDPTNQAASAAASLRELVPAAFDHLRLVNLATAAVAS